VANTVVLTAKGREITASRLVGATPTQAEPKIVAWGTGGVAGGPFTAAASDVAMFSESAEARQSGTSSIVTTTTTNDTYQVAATLTLATAYSVAEAGLSDSVTKPFSTTWTAPPTGTAGTTGTLAASYTPANGTYVQCRGEVMQVTAGSGSANVTVARGQNGSIAATQSAGDVVTLGNPPGSSTSNGSLYCHASFSPTPLNANDTLTTTIQMKYS
jgi:hypothetical protein